MNQTHTLPQKFADFLAHWTALKGAARAPMLSDFLDKPIPRFQPWVAIFDVGDEVVVRLHGTAIVNFYGVDFTGKVSREVFGPHGRAGMSSMNQRIAQTFRGILAVSKGLTSTGRSAEILNMGLPLLRKDGVSVVWLTEPTITLGLGEKGIPNRQIVSEEWIDLGDGVPGN